MSNPHQQAIQQLESVAAVLRDQYIDEKQSEHFDAAIEKLKTPDRVIEGELSVKMDNGKTQKFTAFRSQHNNARGPYKGGIRFHQDVSKEEVMALSTWMTWKCSVTGIPYGGGKGGVIVNPRELSTGELERLSRAYARFVAPHVGPWIDVPAPDVNTTGQIMAWMVDEYEQYLWGQQAGAGSSAGVARTVTENPMACFTGKPLAIGGSAGREEATGLGGFFVLEELAKKLGMKKPGEVTIAVQGFGNVGLWFIKHAAAAGYKIVAMSDSKGGAHVTEGIDPEKAVAVKKDAGTVTAYQGKAITNEELLELEVDILVPAALEGVINADNAANIKAQAIIEMANGPTTPEADEILQKNKVLVVPDVLANAGGVTTSYFEWVQNLHGYYWDRDEVVSKLKPLMVKAFNQMWEQKEGLEQANKQADGRMATYMGAVKRVVDVMLLRGMV